MVSEQEVMNEIKQLIRYYPNLHFYGRESSFWVIRGNFDLHDNAGDYWDTFSIRILIPIGYPEQLPQVFETGNKIPEEMDWHNGSSGCCLSPEAVIYQRLGTVRLYDWFRVFVLSYFANFVYRKKIGHYPKGEFEHMTAGILKGYAELFNLNSKVEILNFISLEIARLRGGRNSLCYCGSGRKLKFCGLISSPYHKSDVRIPLHLLEKDLEEIKKSIE